MNAKAFDEVLNQARGLSRQEQQRLIEALTQPDASDGAKHQSLYDALNARGLIGCLKDAPSDLSTNPKYMEGFGRDAE